MVRDNNNFLIEIEVANQVAVAQESEIEVDGEQLSALGMAFLEAEDYTKRLEMLAIRFSLKYPRSKTVATRQNRGLL